MTQHDIDTLYQFHDVPRGGNVIPFTPPLSAEDEGMLVDIRELLENPETRGYSQKALKMALHHIGAHFVGPKD